MDETEPQNNNQIVEYLLTTILTRLEQHIITTNRKLDELAQANQASIQAQLRANYVSPVRDDSPERSAAVDASELNFDDRWRSILPQEPQLQPNPDDRNIQPNL